MTASVFTRLRELEQKAGKYPATGYLGSDEYIRWNAAARNLFPLLLDVAEKAWAAWPCVFCDHDLGDHHAADCPLAVFVAAAEKEMRQ